MMIKSCCVCRAGVAFPPDFRERVQNIFRRLFRVYAHMYMHHFAVLKEMGAEPHLNTCFRHFVLFVHHFSLIEPRELAPLQELIDKLLDRSKMAPVPKDVTLADAPKAMAPRRATLVVGGGALAASSAPAPAPPTAAMANMSVQQ